MHLLALLLILSIFIFFSNAVFQIFLVIIQIISNFCIFPKKNPIFEKFFTTEALDPQSGCQIISQERYTCVHVVHHENKAISFYYYALKNIVSLHIIVIMCAIIIISLCIYYMLFSSYIKCYIHAHIKYYIHVYLRCYYSCIY